MMNLLQNASDDQVALIGCLLALVGSGVLMYVSFFVGPAAKKSRIDDSIATRQFPINPQELASDTSRERAA